MTSSFVKFSKPIETKRRDTLVRVATIAERMQAPILLVGAFARDLQFFHMYGIEPGRRTEDVDISVQLKSWEAFDAISAELLTNHFSNPNKYHPEKFKDDSNGQEVDLLPFGELSADGKSIIWREDKSLWSIIGMKDAFENALQFEIIVGDNPHVFRFINAPSLVILKMIALYERPEDRQKKDGADIGFVMERYLDIGNRERLGKTPNDDIMNKVEGNLNYASAMLLGRDIRELGSLETKQRILEILLSETTSSSRVRLARELRAICKGSFPEARVLLKWVEAGLNVK